MRLKVLSLGLSILTTLSFGIAWADVRVESREQVPDWAYEDQRALNKKQNGMDLVQKMEFLQQEVQELRGKVEEQAYQLQQLQEQQKKLYLDLDGRIGDSSSGKTVKSESSATGISFDDNDIEIQSAAQPEISVASSADEKAVYQQAYNLIQKRNFESAQLALQGLLRDFPQGKYVPNAHYWLGEIYFATGKLELAQQSFKTVYERYAKHAKASDALLKLAYIEQAQGHIQQSKALFAKVKSQYPQSTSASLAEARLQKMP